MFRRLSSSLTLQPIGFIRTAKPLKFHARHQPKETEVENNSLELLAGHNYDKALRDLEGFSRVWLVWWFHRNDNWRPEVMPPRGPAQRRGVFATRSPHRPNPLGLTAVQLLGVTGRTLQLGACDLVDGTPVFDIKPYIPAYDSFPDATSGWIAEVDQSLAVPPPFSVTLSEQAGIHRHWLLEGWKIDFTARLFEILSRDPSPHRTRRIRKRDGGRFEITCGAWRAIYSVKETSVEIESFSPGYPLRFLRNSDYSEMPDREAQIAFYMHWCGGSDRG